MPSSTARAIARSWSAGAPLVIRPPTAPAPNPNTPTSRPVRPNLRRSIFPPLRRLGAACLLAYDPVVSGAIHELSPDRHRAMRVRRLRHAVRLQFRGGASPRGHRAQGRRAVGDV